MPMLSTRSAALLYSAFFLVAVTCTHVDDIRAAPLSLVPDWTAGVFLMGAAMTTAGDRHRGRLYQIAAWAFMASLLFSSLFANLDDWRAHAADASATAQGEYTLVIGGLLVLAIGGLVSSVRAVRQA